MNRYVKILSWPVISQFWWPVSVVWGTAYIWCRLRSWHYFHLQGILCHFTDISSSVLSVAGVKPGTLWIRTIGSPSSFLTFATDLENKINKEVRIMRSNYQNTKDGPDSDITHVCTHAHTLQTKEDVVSALSHTFRGPLNVSVCLITKIYGKTTT